MHLLQGQLLESIASNTSAATQCSCRTGFKTRLVTSCAHLHACRAKLPLGIITAVAAAGDVLNISYAPGMPDLLLQLPGAEAVADVFKMHKQV